MIGRPSAFPDPRQANAEGLVAIGGPITAELLEDAYSHGIFPWPHEDYPELWFCPDPRGVLFFEELHVPTSLRKFMKKTDWTFTINQTFRQVMKECKEQPRPGQAGTWITEDMTRAYEELHLRGHVVSGEVWAAGELIGGIYGVWLNGVFSGESMFHKKTNASKFAFLGIVEWLQERGCAWMDIQMVTSVTESFGGKYISRDAYLELLRDTQQAQAN